VFTVDVYHTREEHKYTRVPVHPTRVHGPCSQDDAGPRTRVSF